MRRPESPPADSLPLDAAAAALSSLCLLHCLLLPLTLALAPALAGSVLHSPLWLHWALLALAAPVSTYALWRGAELHGDPLPWRLAALGFAMMAAGHGQQRFGRCRPVRQRAGGLVVAAAHWRNFRARP